MRFAVFALALACITGLSAPALALSGGSNDADTAINNATVSLNGNSCTGTLIAPQLVLTAGHCGSINSARMTEFDGTFVPMGQWWPLASPFTVRIGPNPNETDPARIYTAVFMTQAGWADIQIIMLDRPVPASQATPARPLTQLNAAQSAAGFWATQTFTVAGFGGGRPIRQTATWNNGVFPCKNAPNLIANDEFICMLQHNGAELEGGDSGGPIYWTDPATRLRYVIGAYQGNVQFMRLCTGATDGSVDTSACASGTYQVITAGPDGCLRESPTTESRPAWAPQHHTATFFRTGRCWTDRAGATRQQPNIGQWISNAVLYAPTAGTATIPIVQQRVTGPDPRIEIAQFQGSDVYPTLATATVMNPNAPNTWPVGRLPLWRWNVTGGPDQVLYTTFFMGHAYQRVTWNELTLSSPSVVGYVWRNATDAPNLAPLNLYTNLDTHAHITTWNLEAVVPDAAERSRWQYSTRFGYVQVPLQLVRPTTPITPIRPTLPPIRRP
jgi:hypothetical protein